MWSVPLKKSVAFLILNLYFQKYIDLKERLWMYKTYKLSNNLKYIKEWRLR